MSTAEPKEPVVESFADNLGGMFDSRKQRNEHADNGDYDPFEEFNRSAGIGVVENPYPIWKDLYSALKGPYKRFARA